MGPFNLVQEGQYRLEKAEIIPISNPANYADVTNLLNALVINISLTSPLITGHISISDSIGLSEFLPIVGDEFLKVTLSRPASPQIPLNPGDRYKLSLNDEIPATESFSQTFRINKLYNKTRTTDFSLSYMLSFVSQEAIKNFKTKVNKSYYGWLYSDIVKDLFESYCWVTKEKPLICDPSRDIVNYNVCNWRPLEAISQIANRAKPLGYSGAAYIFYEDMKNFRFTTVEKLFEGNSVESYVIQPKNILDSNQRSKELQNSLVSLDSSIAKEDFNVIGNLKKGMYGSRLLTFNLIRETFEDIPYDYHETYEELVHADKAKPVFDSSDLPGSPDSNTFLVHTTKGIEKYGTGEIPFYKEDYLQVRASQILQANTQRISIVVPGNTERFPGQIVKLDVVSPKALEGYPDKQLELHKYQSGKYLIGSVSHTIDRQRYVMNMTLLKDSFVQGLASEDWVPPHEPIMNPET